MVKQILGEAIHRLMHDTKLIRIAFFTTLIHNLVTLLLLANFIFSVLQEEFDVGYDGIFEVMNDILWFFFSNGLHVGLLIIAVIWFLGYVVIYPLGFVMMIRRLEGKWQTMGEIYASSLAKYFPLVVVTSFQYWFTLSSMHITLLVRWWYRWLYETGFVTALIVLLMIMVVLFSFLSPYTEYVVVTEDLPGTPDEQARKAVKRSAFLTIKRPWLTLRFLLVGILLQLRVVVNVLIVFGVPFGITYLITESALLPYDVARIVMYAIGWLLGIGVLYANGIIDAFFTTYRFTLYKRVSGNQLNFSQQQSRSVSTVDQPQSPASAAGFTPTIHHAPYQ